MSNYFGIQKVTFDDRGRLALPSVLKAKKDVAEESKVKVAEGLELIISVQVDGSITFYKKDEWIKEFSTRMEQDKNNPVAIQKWERIKSMAVKQKIDSMSRISVPENILEFAGINVPSKKSTYLSVEDNHFRVWGDVSWQKEMNWLKSFDSRVNDMAEDSSMLVEEKG